MDKDTFVFAGFEPSNTTPVPDVLFDVLLPHLNEAQLKVMLYIIRRTLGFKKTSDAISLNQFRWGITTKKEGKKLDDGCGLKNVTTITTALKHLEQIGCIESEKVRTPEGDQATTVYRIRFVGTTQNVVPTTQNVVGVLRQTEDRTTSSGVRVLRQTYSQETVVQETVVQEEDTFASTDTQPQPATPLGVEAHTPLSDDKQEQLPLLVASAEVSADKGKKKPRLPVDETLKVRVERVYGYFDTLAQETSGDATYRYQRTKKATAAITEWLKGTPTEELLREVYLELWNTPVDIRSGFDWKRNMHIHSVLSQYDSRALAIKAKRHAAQPKPANLFTQPSKPVDDDEEPLQYGPLPSQRNKHNRPFQAIAARRA